MKALFFLVLLSGCGSLQVQTAKSIPLPQPEEVLMSVQPEPIPAPVVFAASSVQPEPIPAPVVFAASAPTVSAASECQGDCDFYESKVKTTMLPDYVQTKVTETTTVTTPLKDGGTKVVTTVVDIIRVVPIAAGVPQAKSVADWITQILIWLGMASPLGIAWYTLYEKKRKRRLKETNSG